MHIFFDMDYTLLGVDGSLRPGTREVLQRLKNDGHTLHIWSGAGIRWPEVRAHGLESFITGCYEKPLDNLQAGLKDWPVPVQPDLVVDDFPEIAAAFGGFWIRPYLHDGGVDDELERIYRLISQHASAHSAAPK